MIVQGENFNEKEITVTLRLTNNCNFKCKYCTYHNNSIKHNYMVFDVLEKLKDYLKNYEKITFYFHGGEPTIYPKFYELIEFINKTFKDFNITIDIQTNASMKIEKFKPYKNVRYICSYQAHQNTKEQFLSFCDICFKNNMLNGIDIILEPDFEKQVREVYFESIKRYGFNKVESNFIDDVYNEKFKDIYKKSSENILFNKSSKNILFNKSSEMYLNEVIVKKLNNFKLWTCNAGKNNIIIDTSDEFITFYKCFSYQKINKYELRIKNLDDLTPLFFKKLLNKTICQVNNCMCEINLKKVKTF